MLLFQNCETYNIIIGIQWILRNTWSMIHMTYFVEWIGVFSIYFGVAASVLRWLTYFDVSLILRIMSHVFLMVKREISLATFFTVLNDASLFCTRCSLNLKLNFLFLDYVFAIFVNQELLLCLEFDLFMRRTVLRCCVSWWIHWRWLIE